MSASLSTDLPQRVQSQGGETIGLAGAINDHISHTPWESFDDQAKWKAFSQRSDDGCWVSQVKVQGMHCSACAAIVEQRLKEVPGVLSAQVDSLTARARIVWQENAVKPSRWLAAASEGGYALLPIQGGDALEIARLAKRAMLWRWLVAGFCMMQVMMYAWPNYSAGPGEIDPTSDRLLRWASLLLTLPVILFSCGPFFRAAWNDILHGRISMDLPVSLGIALTFIVSTAAVVEPKGMWGAELYFDSLTMLVFFLLTGRWLELQLKQKVVGQLEMGADLLPVSAQLLDGSQGAKTVPIHSLNAGDVIQVRTGESFAADGVIAYGQSETEESALTGEALPVAKGVGDLVYAGTTNLSSPLHVKLTKVGTDTRLGQMNHLMQASLHSKPQIVQLADRIAKPFLVTVLILAAIALLYWWPTDPHRGVLAAIAVLIVTCPCALALAAPAAFLSSASALAKEGLLVRDLTALERLERVDHMVFDKTGTLTQTTLSVLSVEVTEGYSVEQVLRWAGVLGSNSLHAVSQAVRQYVDVAGLASGEEFEVLGIQEFAGLGVQGVLSSKNGAQMAYKLGSDRFCGILPKTSAIGQRAVYLSDDHGLLATFYLSEQLRPDAAKTIAVLHDVLNQRSPSMRSHLSIMSGDSAQSVKAIADKLGWDSHDQVLSECSAKDKLAGLQALRSKGYRVAMVGDGINDSPVLAAADVSFAPVQGAALASVKADFLLTSASLAPIALARKQADDTMRIVRQNLTWALIYNLSCVPLALAGVLTPWMAGLGMALSSLLVLMNSLRLQRKGV